MSITKKKKKKIKKKKKKDSNINLKYIIIKNDKNYK